MRWMPKTVRYLAKQGVTFSRALSPHPLCCPARAAILTGQYAQNNGVKSNQDPFNFVALDTKTTLPVWMHQAGYQTAFTGKYLNGYGTHGKPQPGWDYWDATMVNPYSYVGYQMYQNGDAKYYRDLNNVDYINHRLVSLIDDFSATRSRSSSGPRTSPRTGASTRSRTSPRPPSRSRRRASSTASPTSTRRRCSTPATPRPT